MKDKNSTGVRKNFRYYFEYQTFRKTNNITKMVNIQKRTFGNYKFNKLKNSSIFEIPNLTIDNQPKVKKP